jgi:hypothetical protein
MPLRYTEPILDHLAHSAYRPAPAEQLAKDMRISDDERAAFDGAIEKLTKEKKLLKGSDGKLRLPADRCSAAVRTGGKLLAAYLADLLTLCGPLLFA